MIVSPVVLEGAQVRLEPLELRHLAPLCSVGLEPELWRLIPTRVENESDMRRYIETALESRKAGTALPFAIVERASGAVIGSTRYGNIEREHRRLEIGWTWIAPRWQRTGINTEMKFLLLRHAFETLGCNRVELKTDALNARSRAAILRIGAKEEGTFRSHVVCHDGRIRDTVYFSVIRSEWPAVKERFEKVLLKTGASH
jgi:RimJ/RimL family protein N-acetyltransferase